MGTSSDRIAVSLSMIQGPRVLHVGCVGGRLPQNNADRAAWVHGALEHAGFSVLGGDIQRDALNQMAADGREVIFLDAQAIPHAGELFDTIFAGELIEHLESPGLFLRGARERIKPGGRLVISTPNVWSPVSYLHYLKRGHGAFNREHTLWFDQQLLRQLLERCGYRVVELRYVDDLEPERAASFWTSAYTAVWDRVKPIAPDRFKNDMIVWAEPV